MRRNVFILLLTALALLLTCCGGSKPSRFYTLQPVMVSPSGPIHDASSSGSRPSIGIVSVEIPDYLDRPQIVTRNAESGLEVAEFDRWAGDLQKDVARVLAETMSARLPENDVFVLTGRRAVPADYRVMVNVTRFDATPGRDVWLKALWSVLTDGHKIAVRGESNLREPIKGAGHDATVEAMSRAVAKLGADIAGAMKPLLGERMTQSLVSPPLVQSPD